ncbi:ankyrin repeat domain-containing protein [Nostoc sp. FACHB-190]|uniref:ankyrin repeat domain-containing protein n=1 Tax=Nostoc sp. FACHB-190 TaxID=2692838 RepID=UPI001687CFDC|nr:ankyrin repeat domain-containing protein [Nostoc sp. FACHB-190]MBD2302887.1 ankyrin repeat domain-containing protein [Nostoc sp. FACHB-190]
MALIELRLFPSEPEPHDTQLHKIIKEGNYQQIQIIIRDGVNLEKEGENFLTPLGLAASLGQISVVRLLIDSGSCVNNGYYLPLILAAEIGNIDIVRILVEAGADVNAQQGNPPSISSLAMAAAYNRNKIVKYLIQIGAEVNICNCDGWTPLMYAVAKGYMDTTLILLEAKADVNRIDSEQYSVLDIAKQNRRFKIARLLEEMGAKHGQDLLYGRTYPFS